MTSVAFSDDTNLVFVKSSNDLWSKLRAPKEQYHVLFLDLSKRDLQVERVLQAILQDERYGLLPIVVLSAEMELAEVVKQSCSYVAYLPLSNIVLRQALVWCLDRAGAMKLAGSVETPSTFENNWAVNAVGIGQQPVTAAG